jgi:hypothetical protein
LQVKKLRLVVYWDETEKQPNNYSWEDTDWQIDEAVRAGAEIILAIGGRVPRWPECHFPDWLNSLSAAEREQATLDYLTIAIKRYQHIQNITAWQIENEPFLPHFGDCPPPDKELLDKEIALARELDNRPIVITDSGELSLWVPAARRADIFGTSLYRDTYSQQLKRYIHYPILPGFFRFKKNLTNLFAHPDKWVLIELQAEPWCPVALNLTSAAERSRTMDIVKFREIIEFARLSGFNELYLWGAEWWYWEMTAQNNPEMWNEAIIIFNN